MGLAPVLVDQIFEVIKTLHDEGTTILLVEQNAHMALQVADRGYVIQTGEIVLSDDAKALQHNEMIQRVYLGLPSEAPISSVVPQREGVVVVLRQSCVILVLPLVGTSGSRVGRIVLPTERL